jgi:3,8-divinyl chlorophyllide a/chlorophyllide a reductase subunit X
MNATVGKPPAPAASAQASMHERLRAEAAAAPPDAAPSGEGGRKAQVVAIYGKGGIGKSFTLANLSYTNSG